MEPAPRSTVDTPKYIPFRNSWGVRNPRALAGLLGDDRPQEDELLAQLPRLAPVLQHDRARARATQCHAQEPDLPLRQHLVNVVQPLAIPVSRQRPRAADVHLHEAVQRQRVQHRLRIAVEPARRHDQVPDVEQEPAPRRLQHLANERRLADVLVCPLRAIVEVLQQHGDRESLDRRPCRGDDPVAQLVARQRRRERQHVLVEAHSLGREPQVQAEPRTPGPRDGVTRPLAPCGVDVPRIGQADVEVEIMQQQRRGPALERGVQPPARSLDDVDQRVQVVQRRRGRRPGGPQEQR